MHEFCVYGTIVHVNENQLLHIVYSVNQEMDVCMVQCLVSLANILLASYKRSHVNEISNKYW